MPLTARLLWTLSICRVAYAVPSVLINNIAMKYVKQFFVVNVFFFVNSNELVAVLKFLWTHSNERKLIRTDRPFV